ncbi:MAG: polyisoprenoid-binding protein [Chloroflexi bacterium CFX7]|nr:polyisoprenoid-binding protein [Chloroflexi bacterium CFX7]MCK6563294.1 YceI family protein [Dehalococcoidia bacterium]
MAWAIDPTHSTIGFSGKHMLISTVRGQFRTWSADAAIDEQKLENSKATVRIDAASVETGVEQRDNHLRSADFFDVENHPEIVFSLKSVTPDGEDYRLAGDLTIRGTTREVVLKGSVDGPLQDPWGGVRIGVSAEGKLNRNDWGLTFNSVLPTGGLVVGDQIKISIDAELVKAA